MLENETLRVISMAIFLNSPLELKRATQLINLRNLPEGSL